MQWDAQLVRVFHRDTLAAVHPVVSAGTYARRAGEAEASTRQQAFVEQLLGQCERVGPARRHWADAAIAARGVRAIRLLQGVLRLTRTHPRERLLAAVDVALAHQQFRYQTIRRLTEATPAAPPDTPRRHGRLLPARAMASVSTRKILSVFLLALRPEGAQVQDRGIREKLLCGMPPKSECC